MNRKKYLTYPYEIKFLNNNIRIFYLKKENKHSLDELKLSIHFKYTDANKNFLNTMIHLYEHLSFFNVANIFKRDEFSGYSQMCICTFSIRGIDKFKEFISLFINEKENTLNNVFPDKLIEREYKIILNEDYWRENSFNITENAIDKLCCLDDEQPLELYNLNLKQIPNLLKEMIDNVSSENIIFSFVSDDSFRVFEIINETFGNLILSKNFKVEKIFKNIDFDNNNKVYLFSTFQLNLLLLHWGNVSDENIFEEMHNLINYFDTPNIKKNVFAIPIIIGEDVFIHFVMLENITKFFIDSLSEFPIVENLKKKVENKNEKKSLQFCSYGKVEDKIDENYLMQYLLMNYRNEKILLDNDINKKIEDKLKKKTLIFNLNRLGVFNYTEEKLNHKYLEIKKKDLQAFYKGYNSNTGSIFMSQILSAGVEDIFFKGKFFSLVFKYPKFIILNMYNKYYEFATWEIRILFSMTMSQTKCSYCFMFKPKYINYNNLTKIIINYLNTPFIQVVDKTSFERLSIEDYKEKMKTYDYSIRYFYLNKQTYYISSPFNFIMLVFEIDSAFYKKYNSPFILKLDITKYLRNNNGIYYINYDDEKNVAYFYFTSINPNETMELFKKHKSFKDCTRIISLKNKNIYNLKYLPTKHYFKKTII